jgi:hypothetical protein
MSDTPALDDVTAKEEQFLSKLRNKGGHAGNPILRRELGWDENTYWTVRDRLLDKGKLEVGRGRGGSVHLVDQPEAASPTEPTATSSTGQFPTESQLYEPVANVLRSEWAKDMRFRSHHVEVTARQGRRDTGGTWTRPDIVVAALRVFPHIPGKYFDLITFEIKAFDGIDVTAVFEALAHRRAATQAYVWLHVPAERVKENDEKTGLLERINEEARRQGVGLIVGADPTDYSTWDTQLRPIRVEPDPESLNEFIAQQLPPLARDELALWFR